MTWLDWSVLVWVCCMTVNLYQNVVQSRATETWERRYHAAAWGFPFLIALVPFMAHQYGPAGAWCWIVDSSWRFSLWYIPLFVLIAILGGLLFFFVVKKKEEKKNEGFMVGTGAPLTPGPMFIFQRWPTVTFFITSKVRL